jgi:hypothetical protein
MNRLTILADIAGRTMLSTAGSPKTVAGAVAVDTNRLQEARIEVRGLPKWGRCQFEHAEHVVDYLASQAVAVSVVSVNRSTPQWLQFEQDAIVLQSAIVKQSRRVAGWVKAPNFLKFLLLGSACSVAIGHALGVDGRPRIVSATGRQLIECSAICDREVEGSENVEVFTSFWSDQRIPRSRLERLGIDMIAREVRVTTDDDEPALFLADYVAGLGLAASLEDPGRLPLPVDRVRASQLLGKLRARTKLAVREENFAHTHEDIYGDVMAAAEHYADA